MNSGIRARAERLAYPLRLAFDCTTKAFFSTDLWLLAPTAELKVYLVRDAQMLQSLVRISAAANPRPTKKKGREMR